MIRIDNDELLDTADFSSEYILVNQSLSFSGNSTSGYIYKELCKVVIDKPKSYTIYRKYRSDPDFEIENQDSDYNIIFPENINLKFSFLDYEKHIKFLTSVYKKRIYFNIKV